MGAGRGEQDSCSTHLVELLNPSNQVRIAGRVLKIDVICSWGWGRTGKIRGDDRARVPREEERVVVSGPKGDKGPGTEDAEMCKWRDRENKGCPLPPPPPSSKIRPFTLK